MCSRWTHNVSSLTCGCDEGGGGEFFYPPSSSTVDVCLNPLGVCSSYTCVPGGHTVIFFFASLLCWVHGMRFIFGQLCLGSYSLGLASFSFVIIRCSSVGSVCQSIAPKSNFLELYCTKMAVALFLQFFVLQKSFLQISSFMMFCNLL